jgi:hypothetical protein
MTFEDNFKEKDRKRRRENGGWGWGRRVGKKIRKMVALVRERERGKMRRCRGLKQM